MTQRPPSQTQKTIIQKEAEEAHEVNQESKDYDKTDELGIFPVQMSTRVSYER